MPQIDQYFLEMMKQGGSDLHLEQGQRPKIRLHGEMHPIGESALSAEAMESLMQEIARPEWWDKYVRTGDMDFAYAMGDKARFRANFFRQFNGHGAIFRIIPSKIRTLDEMHSPEVLKSFAKLQSGLCLVTGPTGSGKSTTLAAIIDHINSTRDAKIITIEEPVEFVHQPKKALILHREVHTHCDSFASGLVGAIKSDVNVILVGEMRDRETIELALNAAEMGILVFGTLHTNSAAKTIDRIVDVFPAKKKGQIRSVLATSLQGIVSQQLLRTADGKGRVAAYEILLAASGLSGIIRAGDASKLNTLITTGKKEGMVSMDDYLDSLVKQNRVTKEAAFMKALDKNRFKEAEK